MKKITLMVFAILALVVGNSYAVIDLEDSGETGMMYCAELDVPGEVDNVNTDCDGDLSFTFTLNDNQIPASKDIRITIDLDNGATFAADPEATCSGEGCPSFGILSGGMGSSQVIFEANTGEMIVEEGATIFVDPIDGIDLTAAGDVGVSVDIDVADNFGSLDLREASGPLVSFADCLELKIEANTGPDYDLIDVTQDSLFFTGDTEDDTTTLGSLELTVNSYADYDGCNVECVSDILDDVTVTLSNPSGYNAFDQTGGGIDDDDGGDYVISGTDAALTYDTPCDLDLEFDFDVPSDNSVLIDSGDNMVTVDATAADTRWTTDSATGSDYISPLAKNGTMDRADFMLTPGGAYKNYCRIVNPSSIPGDVFITVYKDDGTSITVDLGDIAGQSTSTLDAGASTSLIKIDDVYDAATAADGTNFPADYNGKLRLLVEAEFGTKDTVDVDGTGGITMGTGVKIQAFSLSTDGTTFSMMK